MLDRGAGAGGFGEKVEYFIVFPVNRHEGLINVVPRFRIKCDPPSPEHKLRDGAGQ
jgi:hypothetical protein